MTYTLNNKRNPLIIFESGLTIQTIGDPHLGKVFRNNNKDKIGIRENSQYLSFKELLNTTCDCVVIPGDLFEKPVVANECLKKTIEIIEEACITNPLKEIFILSGNHDLSKNKEKVSSFELLYDYFIKANIPNLFIIKDKYLTKTIKEVSILFTHYNPFSSFDQEVCGVLPSDISLKKDRIAFGHWDTEEYGDSKFINRDIPTTILENFQLVVTGHEHKPIVKTRIVGTKEVKIVVTGSLQPYAFGQEIEEDQGLYSTVTLPQLTSKLYEDSDFFKDKNVKVILEQNEDYPEPFNNLSISFKFKPSESVETIHEEINSLNSFTNQVTNLIDSYSKDFDKEFLDNFKQIFLEKSYESN